MEIPPPVQDRHQSRRRTGRCHTGFNRVKIKSGANAGRFMGCFVLEDLEGSMPVTLFSNQLQQFGHLLADEAVGQVRERGTDSEITVGEILPLKQIAGRPLAGMDLKLNPGLSTTQMLKLRDGEANQSWKRRKNAAGAFAGFIDVTGDLAQGVKDNEALRVFTASGYYDFGDGLLRQQPTCCTIVASTTRRG